MSAWEFKTRNPSKNQMVGPLVRRETVVLLLCYIDNTDSIFFVDYNIFFLLSFNFIFCNASMIPIICKTIYPFVLGVYGNHIPSDEYWLFLLQKWKKNEIVFS